jgi:hypothetical protein
MARRILLFVSANDDYFSLGQCRILHQVKDGEEACVAGIVVEVADGHVKLRLDGQTRANDFWLPIPAALAKQKLFLDGGSYDDDDNAAATMPALHYWDEKDSSQRLRQPPVAASSSVTAAATTTTNTNNTTGQINNNSNNNATDPMV